VDLDAIFEARGLLLIRSTRVIVHYFTLGLLAAIVWTAVWQTSQTARSDQNSGVFLYRTFCASCHGETGKGDGPVADLGPSPADLTRLSANNGGIFPRDAVRSALQMAHRAAGPQGTSMPDWRDVLRRTEHLDDSSIAARIDALVSHLESLQK
jgi:hypothetical protein